MLDSTSLYPRANFPRYDRAQGVILLHDPQQPSQALIECSDLNTVIASVNALSASSDAFVAAMAGYGMALEARQHRDWPTDAQRAALIQASTLLRSALPVSETMDQMLNEALAQADMALLRGESAELALLAFVEAKAAQ